MARRERQRGGGRSEQVRRSVARACLALLAEGDVDLRPSDVAARSGVSRATIYRWWPTTADLVREALTEHTADRLDPPDTGTWEGDLRALVSMLAEFFSDPTEVACNAVMASGLHREYDEIVLTHYLPLFEGWRRIVERARERGEVPPTVDADAVIIALASPLLTIPLLLHRPPTRREVDGLCQLVLAGTARR